MPVAWVTGEPISVALPATHPFMCRSSLSMVRWSWITPFGSLVVPDVYASTASDSGRRRRPLQSGQECTDMYFSISPRTTAESVSL